jgi:hypothetical protein
MCRIWLTKSLKSQPGKELRTIVGKLHKIKDLVQSEHWIVVFFLWYSKHKDYLNQKSFGNKGSYWVAHKMAHKSYITIKRAIPDMFHYLENPSILKSTNGIESYFGYLKQIISLHRGLSKNHFRHYLKWYLYFKNQIRK